MRRFLLSPALAVLLGAVAAACSDPASTDGPRTEHVRYAAIAAGDQHTCALSEQGLAYCWGGGPLLGRAVPDTSATPRRVDGDTTFTQIAADLATCARTQGGAVWCWAVFDYPPAQISGSLSVARITRPLAFSFGCGIQDDGGLACWEGHTVVRAAGPYRDVSVASNCLLDGAGHVLCTQHRLTDRTYTWAPYRARFAAGDSLSVFTRIVGDAGGACALRADGAAYCTTQHTSGAAGSSSQDLLAPVPGGHAFTEISMSRVRACGLDSAGAAWCWTLQGGGSDIVSHFTIGDPVQVAGLPPLAHVSVGPAHACGVTPGGDAYCWGSNQTGQLGTGVLGGSSDAPVKVVDALLEKPAA